VSLVAVFFALLAVLLAPTLNSLGEYWKTRYPPLPFVFTWGGLGLNFFAVLIRIVTFHSLCKIDLLQSVKFILIYTIVQQNRKSFPGKAPRLACISTTPSDYF
jgi:hypothetical protein